MRQSRRQLYEINIWPGFVDILGTILIVTIFTVLISTITQIYFNDQLEIKRGEISSLDNKISNLLSEIQVVSEQKKKKETELKSLKNNFSTLKKKKDKLQNDLTESDYFAKMKNKEINSLVAEKGNLIDSLQKRNQEVETLNDNLKFNKNEIFRLNQNIKVLNKKLSELSSLLIQAEKEDERNKVQIKNLGEKLNQALANKVQELKKYQSSFFKKIKESLGDRDDIKISGDRFIFPSEIFFESGSDQLQLNSLDKLKEVAKDLLEISRKIPKSIDWILRIDGHTDIIPINNDRFNSNWHLSTSRAINIVNFFVKQGIPPHRLVAAGFGENYPLSKEESEQSYRINRRIEIKLTTR